MGSFLVDIGAFDLNLMRPLVPLLEERHISRAAERAGMSQPAMSKALARLRVALGDELLVRVGQAYELTPRGEHLRRELAVALPSLARTLTGLPFDPATAQRVYRVTGTDSTATFLGPGLFRAIHQESPGSSLVLRHWHGRAIEELEHGSTDLVFRAVAPPSNMPAERLLSDRYLCVLSDGHPLAGAEQMCLTDYLQCYHIAVNLVDNRQPNIDDRLSSLAVQRDVAMVSPNHAVALAAVAGSQLVATLPAPLVNAIGPRRGTSVCRAPAEIEPIDWIMVWHPRTETDAAQLWLRQQVREVVALL